MLHWLLCSPIDYVPDQLCVELKSLKLYLWSYRDEGAFHEAVTNRICDDLVAAIAPRSLTVTGKFLVRGGQFTKKHGEARARHIVLEFESYAEALACYDSQEYREAEIVRNRCSKGDVIVIEGYEG